MANVFKTFCFCSLCLLHSQNILDKMCEEKNKFFKATKHDNRITLRGIRFF